MKSKLIIFDCDGVLVDSEILGNIVFADQLNEYGHDMTWKRAAKNGPVAKIENDLQLTSLLSHFVGKIFSAYELRSWKPDPGLFRHAAAHFGIAPEDCVVVEDSYLGVQAGLAANMQVLALDAFDTGEQLSGAKKVFPDIEAVQKYFAERGWAHH